MSFLPGAVGYTEAGTSEAQYEVNSAAGWLIDPVENTNGINVTSLQLASDGQDNADPTVWITTSTSPTDSERIVGRLGGTNTMLFQNIFLPTGFGIRIEERYGYVRYNVL